MNERRSDDHRDRDPRLGEAFGAESQAELETQVPDELMAASWPRLAAEIAARPARSRRRRRLPVALAAALAVMVVLSGWLAGENRQLRRLASEPPAVATPTASSASSRSITAGELVRRLALLPPDTPVLTAEQAVQLVRRDQPLLFALIRGPRLDAVVGDGVTAAEALTILRRLDARTSISLGGLAVERS